MNRPNGISIEMRNTIGATTSMDMINSNSLTNTKKNNKYIILLNILVILFTIPAMFGIGFGIVQPTRIYANNHIETICTHTDTFKEQYYCCHKVCNNTLPLCDDMINLNITGKCCDNNCTDSNICYILCSDCFKIGLTFTYDCKNNETCVYNNINITELKCWYDKTNISSVSFNEPVQVAWYIYYIIALLGFLCVTLLIGINILSNFIGNIEK